MRVVALGLMLLAAPAAAEDRGAAIFLRGAGISAGLSGSSLRLPLGAVACANCHGSDGRGSIPGAAEGGVRAPPVVWSALTRATARRPAYDAAGLRRALAEGVAPDGRALGREMPLFPLDDADFAALLAHLRDLDDSQTRGLTGDAIRLRLPEGDTALAEALAQFNAAGGAWGRTGLAAQGEVFLDLGETVAALRARLDAAAPRRLQALAAGDSGAVILSGPGADTPPGQHIFALGQDIGTDTPRLVAAGHRLTILAPPAEAMEWALTNGLDARAATDLMLAEHALALFLPAGRTVTRASLDRALSDADPADWLETYDFGQGG